MPPSQPCQFNGPPTYDAEPKITLHDRPHNELEKLRTEYQLLTAENERLNAIIEFHQELSALATVGWYFFVSLFTAGVVMDATLPRSLVCGTALIGDLIVVLTGIGIGGSCLVGLFTWWPWVSQLKGRCASARKVFVIIIPAACFAYNLAWFFADVVDEQLRQCQA